MSKTVKQLANEISTPLEQLLKQLADAGINKTESDPISADEEDAC